MALITWLSKNQLIIEIFIFEADFVAMNNGMEALSGLRYKLQIMVFPLTGLSYIYGDNMSVICNTKRQESNLRNKNSSIFYHPMWEYVAMGESLTYFILTNFN